MCRYYRYEISPNFFNHCYNALWSADPPCWIRGILDDCKTGYVKNQIFHLLKMIKVIVFCFLQVGTPSYAYDMAGLRSQGSKALAFPNAFGLTVRYAMKSSPNAAILQVFHNMGIQIDASSGCASKLQISSTVDWKCVQCWVLRFRIIDGSCTATDVSPQSTCILSSLTPRLFCQSSYHILEVASK